MRQSFPAFNKVYNHVKLKLVYKLADLVVVNHTAR